MVRQVCMNTVFWPIPWDFAGTYSKLMRTSLVLKGVVFWLLFLFSAGTEGARQLLNRSGACNMPMSCPFDTSLLALRAFGLTSYKLRGALWTSNIERHQATLLQNSADVHLKQLGVQHPDYIFFTSRSNSRRWVLTVCWISSLYLLQPLCITNGSNATTQCHKKSPETAIWGTFSR